MRRIYISVKLKGKLSHCGIHMQDQSVEYSHTTQYKEMELAYPVTRITFVGEKCL
jgi:hypothetical protein